MYVFMIAYTLPEKCLRQRQTILFLQEYRRSIIEDKYGLLFKGITATLMVLCQKATVKQ